MEFVQNDHVALSESDLKSVLVRGGDDEKKLQQSFSRILPKLSDKSSSSDLTNDGSIVYIKHDGTQESADQVIEKIESLSQDKEMEGLTYVRMQILSGRYSSDKVEEMVDAAAKSLAGNEFHVLADDIVRSSTDPILVRKALTIKTKFMDKTQVKNFLHGIYPQLSEEQKGLVEDFAASAGVPLLDQP